MRIKSIIIAIASLAGLASGCELVTQPGGWQATDEACLDIYADDPCGTAVSDMQIARD